MSDVKAAPAEALPGSERPDYRGKCLYKTGKCVNERALKTSGVAHNLCDEHRNRQNRHQRKLDAKNRLHKRERRVSAKDVRGKRCAPAYRSKHESITMVSDDAEPGDHGAAFSAPLPVAAAVATCDGATSLPASVLATSGSGVVFMPNGTQPPQVPYPCVLQDFDGIVVPLPSYLEGPERIEFRSRIYQKVLDFIAEECVLRFGAKVDSVDALTTTGTAPTNVTSSSELKAEPQANSAETGPALNDDHLLAASTRMSSRSRQHSDV